MAKRLVPVVLVLGLLGLAAPPTGAAAGERALVRFADGVNEARAEAVLGSVGATQLGTVYGTDVLVVRGPDGIVRTLDSHPLTDYAEPDHVMRISLSDPDDPRFDDQYAHQRIDSVDGWTIHPGSYTSSGGATIAVVDTGIDTDHPDLADQIDTANSRCFGLGLLCVLTGYEDDNGHGTHVSGIAAALTNNATGVAGVAYDAEVMALKVCNAIGSCSTSDVASAVRYAADNGADVVNMSLGSSGASTTLHDAVQYAEGKGVVLVAAAGNEGDDTKNYPASFPEVISVAATDSDDERADFSNTNEDVELAAPGVGVLSTYTGNGYRELSGTSMASPHVAGLAGLLVGQNPDWSNDQVRDRMGNCSDDLGDSGRDDSFGFGRIDLERALGTC